MESYSWQEQLRSIMEQTTRNQVSIQKQAFLKIPLAPLSEQKKIARILNKIFERFDSAGDFVNEAYKINKKLNQSIVSKAFRGELVPQDPNDEPASILLERIRQKKSRKPEGQKAKAKQRGNRMKHPKVKHPDIHTVL